MKDRWFKWYIALIICLALFGTYQAFPAYHECRATGQTVGACLLQVRYWTDKRYWGL